MKPIKYKLPIPMLVAARVIFSIMQAALAIWAFGNLPFGLPDMTTRVGAPYNGLIFGRSNKFAVVFAILLS
jgi:hypothetical protein